MGSVVVMRPTMKMMETVVRRMRMRMRTINPRRSTKTYDLRPMACDLPQTTNELRTTDHGAARIPDILATVYAPSLLTSNRISTTKPLSSLLGKIAASPDFSLAHARCPRRGRYRRSIEPNQTSDVGIGSGIGTAGWRCGDVDGAPPTSSRSTLPSFTNNRVASGGRRACCRARAKPTNRACSSTACYDNRRRFRHLDWIWEVVE
jgi:hypothetical protein